MHSLLFIVFFALYVSFAAIFNQMKIFCVGDICGARLHNFIICLPARLYAMFLVPLNSHSSSLPLCQAPFSTCRLIFSLFLLTPPHSVTTLYPSSSISLSSLPYPRFLFRCRSLSFSLTVNLFIKVGITRARHDSKM